MDADVFEVGPLTFDYTLPKFAEPDPFLTTVAIILSLVNTVHLILGIFLIFAAKERERAVTDWEVCALLLLATETVLLFFAVGQLYASGALAFASALALPIFSLFAVVTVTSLAIVIVKTRSFYKEDTPPIKV